jgi:predicted acetyltransferase
MESRSPHSSAELPNTSASRFKGIQCGKEPTILSANAGDHGLVHEFLRFVQGGHASDDFANWLDEPTYEPNDRILVKLGERLGGHAHLLQRVAMFDGVSLPVACLVDFALLPDLRETIWERSLLEAAQRAAIDSHAVVAMARTARPEPFMACGWLPARGQGHSHANTHEILSQLAGNTAIDMRRQSLHVRLWRHMELDALCRTYGSLAERRWGILQRSEAYWRWLVGRKVHDSLLICSEGTDRADDEPIDSRIVGCAMTHGSQILELHYLATHPLAGVLLLARACQDAIEQDYHHVSLHAPVEEPVHQHLIHAEGEWHSESNADGECLMVKLLDPERWFELMFPVLDARATEAALPRPAVLRIDDGRQRLRLELNRRGSRLATAKVREIDVRGTSEAIHSLFIGNLDIDEARAAGQIEPADARIGESLAALFPARSFAPSPFDMRRF